MCGLRLLFGFLFCGFISPRLALSGGWELGSCLRWVVGGMFFGVYGGLLPGFDFGGVLSFVGRSGCCCLVSKRRFSDNRSLISVPILVAIDVIHLDFPRILSPFWLSLSVYLRFLLQI